MEPKEVESIDHIINEIKNKCNNNEKLIQKGKQIRSDQTKQQTRV